MTNAKSFGSEFNVSRETTERLTEYEYLLRKWTSKINLVSKSTLDDVWKRHFSDSAQVFKLMPTGIQKIADLGSGGGLPGIVIAIMNLEIQSGSHVVMIESDLRKSTFLSTVIRELGLNATVLAKRIEAAAPLSASVITARALAPLEELLPYADMHLAVDGTSIFLKGARHQEEVDLARAKWDFDLETHDSLTQSGAAVLRVTNLKART